MCVCRYSLPLIIQVFSLSSGYKHRHTHSHVCFTIYIFLYLGVIIAATDKNLNFSLLGNKSYGRCMVGKLIERYFAHHVRTHTPIIFHTQWRQQQQPTEVRIIRDRRLLIIVSLRPTHAQMIPHYVVIVVRGIYAETHVRHTMNGNVIASFLLCEKDIPRISLVRTCACSREMGWVRESGRRERKENIGEKKTRHLT